MNEAERQHQIIAAIKELTIELGKTPSRNEFIFKSKFGRHDIDKYFGTYAALLQAAGLEQKITRVTNKIFEKDIESHLSTYQSKESIPHIDISYTPTIILGDTHFPFVHNDKLKKALEIIEVVKPKRVIQIGDLYDCMAHAKFARSLNIYTPKEEMTLARKGAQEMWRTIQTLSPGVECHQLSGNHDVRIMRRVLEQYPEIEMFVDFEKWFTFDGVQSHMDIRKELILDGIVYIHGHRSKLGEHMEYMRRSVICGHSHRPGIAYKNYGDTVLFEMNVGYLGDPESKALSYTNQKYTHWSHGCGLINQHGPQFISF